jgi:hypothetical protein
VNVFKVAGLKPVGSLENVQADSPPRFGSMVAEILPSRTSLFTEPVIVVRDVMEVVLVVRGVFLGVQAAILSNRAIDRERIDMMNTVFPFL